MSDLRQHLTACAAQFAHAAATISYEEILSRLENRELFLAYIDAEIIKMRMALATLTEHIKHEKAPSVSDQTDQTNTTGTEDGK